MNLSPEDVSRAARARIRQRGSSVMFKSLLTDSRHIKKDGLFFALSGPNFDGHDYVRDALRKGAAGAVVQKGRRVSAPARSWLFTVKDPLKTLGDVAAAWRNRFSIPVVAISGSNGKTTTKEMLSRVLGMRYRLLKTEGNFNNLIGLPLTVYRLNRRHEMAILEMGMNAPGEIRRLCRIAKPQYAVVTNVARAHLEGLGSLSAVARAKAELVESLPSDGLAVLNADDARVRAMARLTRADIITYGFSAAADIRGHRLQVKPDGGCHFEVSGLGPRFRVTLSLAGRHNATNALAAIALAQHFKISPAQMTRALLKIELPTGRMEKLQLAGKTVLDDSYNANPDSVLQALATLRGYNTARRKVAVLGDMLELGRISPSAHREIGRVAARAGTQELVAVGQWADEIAAGARRAGMAARHIHRCQDAQEAGRLLQVLTARGDLVLFKASREVKLEQAIPYLKRRSHS